MPMGDLTHSIQVIHRDPGRYSHFKKHAYGDDELRGIIYVGRSMYETGIRHV